MMRRRPPLRVAWPLIALALLLCSPVVSMAQLIPIKTVPVAEADQFGVFPSLNRGMGSVSIAVDDPLLDPFVNPAKGARLTESRLFLSPTFQHISRGLGGARSLPGGLLYQSGGWFGASILALQGLEGPDPPRFVPFSTSIIDTRHVPEFSARSGHNFYTFGSIGRTLTGTDVAVAGSVFWADLGALEGIQQLFPFSPGMEQSGDVLDFRVGVTGQLSGGRGWEMLLLHHHKDMTYKFEPILVDGSEPTPRQPEEDRADTWGAHLGYVTPILGDGWRLGGILTANYQDYNNVPDSELTDIFRRPGRSMGESWALEAGVGLARAFRATRFGVDLVMEPIWSDIWVELESPLSGVGAEPLAAGAKTQDSDYRFINALMRTGVAVEAGHAGFEMGLQVKAINYSLEFTDLLGGWQRRQHERWIEWTPTWGVGLTFEAFDVHYTGRVTAGAGRLGTRTILLPVSRSSSGAGSTAGSDYIVAPPGPFTLQEASAFSHQVYVTIPIGG